MKIVNGEGKKKFKVLVVAGPMEIGGLENQLMYLIRNANKDEFHFDYTLYDKSAYYSDEIERLGGESIAIPNTDGIHFFKYCRALYRVLKNGEYDIVHSNELFHSGLVLLTAKLAGVKHRFVHAHNIAEGVGEKPSFVRRFYNAVMRFLILRCATEFCACSTPAGEFLYGKGITEKENFHLIFNSFEASAFTDNYDNVETGEFCDGEWKNVIQVSRFSEVKNQLFTADIASVFKGKGKKIRILLAGDDNNEYGALVKEKVLKNGLQDYVLILGARSDVASLERKSSAFLLPSLYEGMPLALIEAQATGLPCVVADTFSREVDFEIGGIEWVKLSENADFWAEAVERAVNKSRAQKRDVVNAVKRKGFESSAFSDKIFDLYKKSCKETT